MAHGGRAIGKQNRRMVFIPYAIPGETILARINHAADKVDFAEGVKLLNASADRVFPQCNHFGQGRCWGCQWQHIAYEAQLALKYDVLADQLSRLGRLTDKVLERTLNDVLPSPEQWGYNYHMILSRNEQGAFGFLQADNRHIEVIQECLIMHPDLLALHQTLDIDFADLKRMRLQLGSDGKTMVILEMTSENAPELTTDFPTSANALLPDNEPINLIGDAHTTYRIGDRDFRITAGGEFRANVEQVDQNLIPTILRACDLNGHESVLDLYAGMGVYSAFLAPRSSLVTLVESYPPTVTDAEENLADFENVDIVEGTVEDVLPILIESDEKYDVAVVDPPTRGLSKEALNLIVKMNIPRLVYVSSEPSSIARDSKQLIRAGYQLLSIQPIDFAPQTYYIDAVFCFVRE